MDLGDSGTSRKLLSPCFYKCYFFNSERISKFFLFHFIEKVVTETRFFRLSLIYWFSGNIRIRFIIICNKIYKIWISASIINPSTFICFTSISFFASTKLKYFNKKLESTEMIDYIKIRGSWIRRIMLKIINLFIFDFVILFKNINLSQIYNFRLL